MQSFTFVLRVIIFSHLLQVHAQFETFLTQPTIKAVAVNIVTDRNPSQQSTGYYFVAPYITAGQSFGPHIIDTYGVSITPLAQNGRKQAGLTKTQNHVWYGNATVEKRAMNFQVCTYLGKTVLCYDDGLPGDAVGGHSIGVNRFFDSTYTEIPNSMVGASNGLLGPDTHELNTPPGQAGAALVQTVYQPRAVDLTAYGGPAAGWVLDGCFQEVSLETHATIFQWCAMDHVSLGDSYIAMAQTGRVSNNIAGSGTQADPWDYFHINAIAREVNGDYAVSGRHMNTIFKVCGASGDNGAPGSIQWRLGGKRNQFAKAFNFSSQHMVRFHTTAKTITHLTLFDNAADGTTSTATKSAGLLLWLNNSTMEAGLVTSYPSPDGQLAISQGSVHVQANGNPVIGWGFLPSYSEFTSAGALLYHARYLAKGMQSYRVFRFPWVGQPPSNPALLAYAQTCSSAMTAYVSWNGATEAVLWRFSVTHNSVSGPWTNISTVAKNGFETQAAISKTFFPYVMVEAVDRYNNVIGQSGIVHTFVPVSTLGCAATNCSAGTNYTLPSNSMASKCS